MPGSLTVCNSLPSVAGNPPADRVYYVRMRKTAGSLAVVAAARLATALATGASLPGDISRAQVPLVAAQTVPLQPWCSRSRFPACRDRCFSARGRFGSRSSPRIGAGLGGFSPSIRAPAACVERSGCRLARCGSSRASARYGIANRGSGVRARARRPGRGEGCLGRAVEAKPTEQDLLTEAQEERMMGLEPTTFCMASRRSSQLSYIRAGAKYS